MSKGPERVARADRAMLFDSCIVLWNHASANNICHSNKSYEGHTTDALGQEADEGRVSDETPRGAAQKCRSAGARMEKSGSGHTESFRTEYIGP